MATIFKAMNKIKNNILELVGQTPLLRLNQVVDQCPASIYAKLEFFNPSGSVKARAALAMINAAEQAGLVRPGSTIVEPTSGNTGVALAMVGAVKGYQVIMVMPETASQERQLLAKAYGARVVLTPAHLGVPGAVQKAKAIAIKLPDAYMPDQFTNPHNPACHANTTAQEILEQLNEEIHGLVVGVGTGGTLTGIAKVLKKHYPRLQVIAVEPKNSALLSGGKPGPHAIEGIGDGFIPANLDLSLVESSLTVSDREAMVMTRRLAREEGLLVGVSSGAAVFAAVTLGHQMGVNKNIITVLADTGERYLSTGVFSEQN